LLTFIKDKFGSITSKTDGEHPVQSLSTKELSILLHEKTLSVETEDEVVDALQTWLNANLDTIVDDKSLVEDLL
jgi:hypothetical protein